MGASRENEDEAYRKFAEACGRAWLGKTSTLATEQRESDAVRIDEANPTQPLLAQMPFEARRGRPERAARR